DMRHALESATDSLSQELRSALKERHSVEAEAARARETCERLRAEREALSEELFVSQTNVRYMRGRKGGVATRLAFARVMEFAV
ncbi:unnamed protein product, partial [Ostreobium quekettii]